ncbi:hypothetical protein [Kutzneria sp. NPDC052558]|uniref:LppU/SCO3897 family protein n=1 Tax=Kutzneria sp. NPDC052558 TaxID=3364121 RepID=UPI0037C9CB4C
MTGPYPQPGSWGPPPSPPRKSQAGAVVATIAAVVLMLGLGTWAVVGIISSRHSAEAGGASTSTTSTTKTTSRVPRTSSVNSNQYHVNDCTWLDVESSEQVSCTSDKAALQINLVIPKSSKCPAVFDSYGDTWYDDEVSTRYCASLAVPKGQCVKMDLDGTGLVERVACGGSSTKTYQVLDVVSGTDGKTACAKTPGTDDTWFYQSNLSGQFACLKQFGA